jgi:hypothetical protein
VQIRVIRVEWLLFWGQVTHMTLPVFRCRSFVVPKGGHAADECEDAAVCNSPAGRFAVADGASESIYCGEWARFLCEAFAADPTAADGIGPWVGIAQKKWRAHVHGRPAPWHVAEKLEDGAFATFLGLAVEPGRWQAVATGDTCLFLVRGDALKRAFPVQAAGGFGTRPELIGSRTRGRVRAAAVKGALEAGDRLWLMTDALAEWFLTEHEAGRAPWEELAAVTADGFAAWVDGRRADGRLKNDDVTVIEIEYVAEASGVA